MLELEPGNWNRTRRGGGAAPGPLTGSSSNSSLATAQPLQPRNRHRKRGVTVATVVIVGERPEGR
jgi:hypothetical protein